MECRQLDRRGDRLLHDRSDRGDSPGRARAHVNQRARLHELDHGVCVGSAGQRSVHRASLRSARRGTAGRWLSGARRIVKPGRSSSSRVSSMRCGLWRGAGWRATSTNARIVAAAPGQSGSGALRCSRRWRRDTMAGALEGASGPAGRTVSTSAKLVLALASSLPELRAAGVGGRCHVSFVS